MERQIQFEHYGVSISAYIEEWGGTFRDEDDNLHTTVWKIIVLGGSGDDTVTDSSTVFDESHVPQTDEDLKKRAIDAYEYAFESKFKRRVDDPVPDDDTSEFMPYKVWQRQWDELPEKLRQKLSKLRRCCAGEWEHMDSVTRMHEVLYVRMGLWNRIRVEFGCPPKWWRILFD